MTNPIPSPAPRGACPTLAAPMPVADGLLARFRPVAGLTAEQVAALARAAQASGNGRIEVTARGSIQVRGLTAESEEDFRAALDAGGIVARTGVVIECSPIAGEDPEEIRDPLPLLRALEAVCAEVSARGSLSPKLSIVLDSGGQVSPGGFKADIGLRARAEGWTMEVGGAPAGLLAEDAVPVAVADVLKRLQAIGPRARGSDLAAEDSIHADVIPGFIPGIQQRSFHRPGVCGNIALDPGNKSRGDIGGEVVLEGARKGLRVGLPFGQISSGQLSGLARVMEAHGVVEARPAPERTLVLIGASEGLSPALAALGLWTGGEAVGLSLCSGAEAGEGGIVHAADVARAFVAAAPELADGSVHLHVSTCAKGCAYAGRAGIVLAGNQLSIYRSASQKPFARLDPAAIEAGIASLAARIRADRRPGETTLECLKRHDAI